MSGRALLLIAVLSVAATADAQDVQQPDAQLVEGRRLVDAAEYDNALPVLDAAVARLGALTGERARAGLVEALELRGRVHYTLGNEQQAADDFGRLLTLDPEHTLPAVVSPRIATIFDQVRLLRVGSVTLIADPPDAMLQIDGKPATASAPIRLAAGDHTVTATRPGYSGASLPLVVAGGTDQTFPVTLTRVSAALSIVTSPPGVEIIVNGSARGATVAGPLAPEYADLPGRLAISAADIARPMVLSDLSPGTITLQFRKPCYQSELRSFQIETPRDYRIEPIVLKPAVSMLRVESSDADATVFIDNQSRGAPPLELRDLCEGPHVIELRSPSGRYQERVNATPGGSIKIAGSIKPAFAIVAVAGLPAGYRGQDLRLDVERALSSAKGISLIAPAIDLLKPLLANDQLLEDSLAFDLAKNPVGAAARMTPSVRRDVVRRLSQTLQVQGIATLTVIGGETAVQRLSLALFASGGSAPDCVLVDLQAPAAILKAIDTLDVSPAFSVPSLGMLAIEVGDVEGVVVAGVDTGGPAEQAGLKTGERITQILTEKVADEATLVRVLEERRSAESLPAVVTDRAGVPRQVSLRPVIAPRLVSVFDQTLPFNALAVQWRNRARRASPGGEGALIRLNLAVAALRIGDFESARDELNGIQLGVGAGISRGTVDYLLGMAYKNLADLSRAREAWKRAAAAEGATLSDHGGRVAELAKQELQALLGTP